MKQFIGLDVGGTKIEGILVNENMKAIKRARRATEAEKNRERVISNIAAVVEELGEAAGVGIGLPGFEDSKGRIQLSPNIPQFENFNARKAIEKKLKRRIVLENDAHCFVLAEQRIGAAKGAKNVIGLTLGTGVGGGAIINGEIYRGKNGGAAHFGHMTIDASGPKCSCGLKGDVESWCGGKYLERRYAMRTGKKLHAEEIFSSKEKAAVKTIKEFYEKLGITIANLANAFNPEYIVLGGSVTGSVNIGRLLKEIKRYGKEPLIKETRIVKSKLGAAAGVIGAAMLAAEQQLQDRMPHRV